MEPFGKKAFKVDIFVPMGELAERIGELTITATVQGEETLDIGSDSVQINIQEFRQMTPVIGSDYILDLPAEGEIELELRNDGNVDTRFILFDMENIEGVPDTGNGLDLHPGETGTFTFEYSLSGDLTIQQLSSIFGDGSINENILDLRFLKDGELFHLLFRPGPFLILTPDLDAGPLSVNIFSLGGKLENIGLEIVDGPEDAYIEIDERPDLSDLERRSLEFKVGGFTGNEILTIRAYGFDGDTRSGSNPILVSVQGDRAEGGPLISTSAAVAGGSMAAAVTLTAGAAVYLYSASEVFRYRWLLLALVPLYSITRGAKVLDHFFRGRLFEYIKENPGATFTALKEHFEANNGTLTYHLHKLEREEQVQAAAIGNGR
ncbi:MAG: hypothetical protein U9R75_02305, partial [Candidatus Thermoplasmatota archaeon]|nr:hypothetical protein [Candidatus Thermoplasmatota archaeon]